jgi:hypothetical protein
MMGERVTTNYDSVVQCQRLHSGIRSQFFDRGPVREFILKLNNKLLLQN